MRARLSPRTTIGAVAQGVIGPGAEVESGPAVAVWAADLGEGSAHPFRSWAISSANGTQHVAGWPDTAPGDATVLLADPSSFPTASVLERLGRQRPAPVVLGGLVTGGPGANRYLLDDRAYEGGAVGVVLRGLPIEGIVSQGARPVGDPLTVTRSAGDRVLELGGGPAVARLQEVLAEVDPVDLALLRSGGFHLGVVVDELRETYGPGDFVVRGVLGIDLEAGALTIGDHVEVGSTVQFHVRDGSWASAEHHLRLDERGPLEGALLFACTRRGKQLFGSPGHDVEALGRRVRGGVAGAFCAAEIGPLGPRNHLLAFTAVTAGFGQAGGGSA